ncbi:MAG: hypothetical protein WKF75_02105 [Singulisphaera sp.]
MRWRRARRHDTALRRLDDAIEPTRIGRASRRGPVLGRGKIDEARPPTSARWNRPAPGRQPPAATLQLAHKQADQALATRSVLEMAPIPAHHQRPAPGAQTSHPGIADLRFAASTSRTGPTSSTWPWHSTPTTSPRTPSRPPSEP